jgi:hypothetical protein
MKKTKQWFIWMYNGDINIYKFLNSCSADDTIVLFMPEEHEIFSSFDYKKHLEKFKNITMVVGTYNSNYLYQYGLPENVNVINFPNFLIYYTISHIQVRKIPETPKKKVLFSVFVKRQDPYRARLFDMLAKYDLLKNSYYSWNQVYDLTQPDYYEPKFWNSAVKQIDMTDTFHPPTLPKIMFNSVIQLVPESNMFVPFITEKTYNSIVHKMPFIIYGPPGAHEYIESLGFKLPRDIIRYDRFDDIIDINEKSIRIAEELHRLSSFDLTELALALKPTADYNFNLLLDIASKEEIPDLIKHNRYYKFYIDNTRIVLEHLNRFR